MALGEILKKARVEKGYSISDVAENTHMMVQLVESIENEDFRRIAAAIYGRGFVRLYAEFVGLDPAPLIRDFMSIYDGAKPPVVKTRGTPVTTPPEKREVEPSSVPPKEALSVKVPPAVSVSGGVRVTRPPVRPGGEAEAPSSPAPAPLPDIPPVGALFARKVPDVPCASVKPPQTPLSEKPEEKSLEPPALPLVSRLPVPPKPDAIPHISTTDPAPFANPLKPSGEELPDSPEAPLPVIVQKRSKPIFAGGVAEVNPGKPEEESVPFVPLRGASIFESGEEGGENSPAPDSAGSGQEEVSPIGIRRLSTKDYRNESAPDGSIPSREGTPEGENIAPSPSGKGNTPVWRERCRSGLSQTSAGLKKGWGKLKESWTLALLHSRGILIGLASLAAALLLVFGVRMVFKMSENRVKTASIEQVKRCEPPPAIYAD